MAYERANVGTFLRSLIERFDILDRNPFLALDLAREAGDVGQIDKCRRACNKVLPAGLQLRRNDVLPFVRGEARFNDDDRNSAPEQIEAELVDPIPEHVAELTPSEGGYAAAKRLRIAVSVWEDTEEPALYKRRIQESLERARSLGIKRLIKAEADDSKPRAATPRQRQERRRAILRQVCDSQTAGLRLERILQGNELSDVSYLAQGLVAAQSVGRVVIRHHGTLLGFGTGFLVAPGVLLTNEQVLETAAMVSESRVEFRYERDLRGRDIDPVTFDFSAEPSPIIFRDLDLAVVAVRPVSTDGHSAIAQFGWLRLSPEPGKAFVGEYLTIIQHPNGERKQICVRENKLLKYSENGPFLWYQTDTVGGSSGSAVFNNSWQVVALHHSSVPRTKRVNGVDVWLAKDGSRWTPSMGDDQVDWMAGEGVRVSQIIRYLRVEHSSHPLAQAVFDAPEPPGFDLSSSTTGARSGLQALTAGSEGTLVPVKTDVPELDADAGSGLTSSRVVEKVVIDQKNYGKRNGFNPKFLGDGRTVTLPRVVGSKEKKQVLSIGQNGVLKYWNYSIVMNRPRGLAFFSAANVDPGQWRGNRDADGDTWYRDTRVDKVDARAQLGQEFYGSQKTFEADRTKNPFDRGHLTRRRDAQWGKNDAEAKRNGDESYHFTNCSPQHWQFNQNNKASGLWFRLEESAASKLSNGGPLCVINGPVFDAPFCTPGSDGRLHLNLKGKRVSDGTFGGVAIPKQFFKVIAYNQDGELRAKAFVVTQEDLLATIDRFYPQEATKKPALLSDLEVRLYRVKLADLEKLTGLDFGSLKGADLTGSPDEAARAAAGSPIEDEAELFG